MHIYIYMYTYIYTYIWLYIHIYIHTYMYMSVGPSNVLVCIHVTIKLVSSMTHNSIIELYNTHVSPSPPETLWCEDGLLVESRLWGRRCARDACWKTRFFVFSFRCLSSIVFTSCHQNLVQNLVSWYESLPDSQTQTTIVIPNFNSINRRLISKLLVCMKIEIRGSSPRCFFLPSPILVCPLL